MGIDGKRRRLTSFPRSQQLAAKSSTRTHDAQPPDNRREAAIHPAALPRPFSKGLHAGGYLTNWGYGQASAPLEMEVLRPGSKVLA